MAGVGGSLAGARSITLSIGGVGYMIRSNGYGGWIVYRRMRGRYWSSGVVGAIEEREVLRAAGLVPEPGCRGWD